MVTFDQSQTAFQHFSNSLFFTVKLFIGSFQDYKSNIKEKTSKTQSASYSPDLCPFAKLLLFSQS